PYEERRRLDLVEELPAVHGLPRSVALWVEAIEEATLPLHDSLPAQVLQELWCGQGLSGQEPEALEGQIERLVAPRTTMPSPVHGLQPSHGQGRSAVHYAEHAHPVGMPRGESHGIVAAHRVPHERHLLPAERIDDAQKVGRELLRPIAGVRRPVALAVSPLVYDHHITPLN